MKSEVLILREPEIRALLDPAACIDAVEKAFAAYSTGRAELPVVLHLHVPENHGEIHIKAGPEAVFDYLVDPIKYVQWGGSEAVIDPRPGGIYRVLMGGTHQSAGEFLEVVPNERVVFSFGWAEPGHPIPSGSTRVEIRLLPDELGTVVRLTHSGLPEDAVSDHTGRK